MTVSTTGAGEPTQPFAGVTVLLAAAVLLSELLLPDWASLLVAVGVLLLVGVQAPSARHVVWVAALETAAILMSAVLLDRNAGLDPHSLSHAAVSIALVWAVTGLCLRHQATLRRVTEARVRLTEAMESISEGFILFDAADRLVTCNRRVKEMFPEIRDMFVPGMTAAEIFRIGAERGQFDLGGRSVEDFVAARMGTRAAPDSVVEQKLGDGRWIRISERRTADGGRAGIRTDITEEKRREETLRRTGQRFRSISANAPTVIFQRLMTPDGAISYPYISAGAREMYGIEPAEIMAGGGWIDACVSPEQRGAYLQTIHESARTLETWQFEGQVKTRIGSTIWIRAVARPTRHENGDVTWDGVVLDVTAFKRTEDELRNRVIDLQETQDRLETQGAELAAMAESLGVARDEAEVASRRAEASEQRYRMLAEHSPVGIWHFGPDGNTRYMNPAMRAMVGAASADLVAGRDFRAIVQSGSVAVIEQTVARARAVGTASCSIELYAPGADTRQVVFSASELRSADGSDEGILASVIDMTEQRRMEDAMLHMAQHDTLTGLPNRALFNDRVQQALAQAERAHRPVAVLLLDLDRFKHVNDMLGHVIGDQLLQAVAERLRQSTRRSDTVARLGGDEFAIIATNLDSAEMVEVLARRVIESLAQPFMLDGNEIHTGTSIGITLFPSDTREPSELLRFADMALYRAKDVGRGTYAYYDQSMNDGARARKELEAELRRALQEQQFELHYQPKMDVATTRITGFEALIRWRHPEKGLVPPDVFIPVAESSGLILPIGRWVLETACAQAAIWHAQGFPDLIAAVNLSPAQFARQDVVQQVKDVLETTAVPADRLELEITETLVLGDIERINDKLNALSALGVSIAVDDFGTGYSSITYVKRLPIDRLKIDRSFVRDVTTDKDDAALTETIIRMSQTLGLHVTAEGVETAEQLAFLRRHGCEEAQGYYFSKPLPAAQFGDFLEQHRARVADNISATERFERAVAGL